LASSRHFATFATASSAARRAHHFKPLGLTT
jgi:hypothetical protein